MQQFFAEHWITLLFGLLSAFIIWYCRRLYKKFNDYKNLLNQKQIETFEQMIKEKLKPYDTHFTKLDHYITAIEESYRFRLITLCQLYLEQGYLTAAEYSQISEMWKVYKALGGNGQGQDYYHKVEQLPIK